MRYSARDRSGLDVSLSTCCWHHVANSAVLFGLGIPIVGDPLYGGRKRLPKNCSTALKDIIAEFPRQALHACHLGLKHPLSGEQQSYSAVTPDDFQSLLTALEEDSSK